MSILDPGMPREQKIQRLTSELATVRSRIEQLERTRGRVSFGAGPPTEVNSANSVEYVDTTNGKVYIKGPDGWINSDALRAYQERLGTISSTSTNPAVWQVQDGPSITLTIPQGGFVMLLADVEIKPGGTGGGNGYVGFYESGELAVPQIAMAWEAEASPTFHRMTNSGRRGGILFGAQWPLGDFWMFRAAAGTRTYALRYSANGTGVQWRNRRLYGVAF